MDPSVDLYPELVAECGAVALRVAPVADLLVLAGYVADGLFPDGPSTLGEWYDPDDLVASARRTVAYHLSALAERSPDRLDLPLGVYVDGVVIGVQSLHAEHITVTREVATGSWLAPGHRGRGHGRAAREAALAVAFEALGADWATTASLVDNGASLGVTAATGYRPDGVRVEVVRGRREVLRRFRQSRDEWAARDRPTVRVAGFGRWLADTGLGPA